VGAAIDFIAMMPDGTGQAVQWPPGLVLDGPAAITAMTVRPEPLRENAQAHGRKDPGMPCSLPD
jgi:hypothetical protein